MVPRPPLVSQRLGAEKPKCCAAHIWCWPTSVVMIGSRPRVASNSAFTARCGMISASDSFFSGKSRQRVARQRSEEHTSELQSLMRISYAVFCLKKKKNTYKRKERERQRRHTSRRLL